MKRHLWTLGRWLDQREYEYTTGGYNENLGNQEYHEEDSYYQVGKSCWMEMKKWEETLEEIMRAIKNLGIPT